MDTIIYFFQKRDPMQREITLMYQEDYLLAKVGICADRHSWFGSPLPCKPEADEFAPDLTENGESAAEMQGSEGRFRRENTSGLNLFIRFRRRRQMREKQRELRRCRQEYMQKLQEYEEQRQELADGIQHLREEVFSEVEQAGGMGEVRGVYEDSLRFLTEDAGEAAACWRQIWDIPEFGDYQKIRWVRPLLEDVRHSHFILLGAADGIPEILARFARQMKSLQWYIKEEDMSEDVQSWVDDFYEEYGLAPALRELAGENAFKRLKLKSEAPACVLDFSKESKLFAGNLAEGSIWLDFCSVDEKALRMTRQAPGVRYVSLKKYWGEKNKLKPVFPACRTVSRFRLQACQTYVTPRTDTDAAP